MSSTVRLKPLDALRGVAALGVAFFHYQHFGGDSKLYPWRNSEPASWLYARGWMLVDFFFVLSGVVLTYKYLKPLTEKALSGRDFLFLRLSRIYPLHFATLLVCAITEWRLMANKLPTLIYGNDDLYHFVLNLFFLQNGIAEEGFSFNGASWSVGTEVVAYVVFFWLTQRHGKRYVAMAFSALVVGLSIYKARFSFPFLNETVARTLIGFFTGSLLYLVIQSAEKRGTARYLGFAALALLALIVSLVQWIGYDAVIGGSGFRTAVPHTISIFPLVVVAALTVPVLSSILSIRPLTYLGDISYAVYLLHVPLQMIIISYFNAHHRRIPTEKPIFLLSFLISLLVLATLVHRLFEVPAREWLRKRLVESKPATA